MTGLVPAKKVAGIEYTELCCLPVMSSTVCYILGAIHALPWNGMIDFQNDPNDPMGRH